MTNKSQELAKGLFGGIADAKGSNDSDWERAGDYISRIDRVRLDRTRKGDTGFYIEKTILHVIEDTEGKPHRPGESVTHALWAKHDSFLGNVKSFLAATLGVDPGTISEDNVMLVVGDDQPLAGSVIETSNRTIMTKNKNIPFTKITYRGAVEAKRLKEILSDRIKERFFPDDLLDAMQEIEEEG